MLALLVILFFGPAPAQFADLSRQAAEARDGNRPQEAAALYRECVKLQPSWAEGWWYLGSLLYDANSFDQAENAFKQLVNLDRKNAPGFALLGLSEFETKEYPQSLEHLQRALVLGLGQSPQIAKVVRFHAGLLLTHFGDFEAAQAMLLHLALEGAEDPNLITALGTAGLRLALLPAEMPPDKRAFIAEVGQALYDSGARKVADAQRAFAELVKEHPNTPEIHNLYGAFLLPNDPDAALREWKQELQISPHHVPAMLQLAFEYLKRGEASKGLPYAAEAAKLEPRSFVAHNALGRLLLETGAVKAGVAELEKARDLAPDSAATRVALASAYAKAGRSGDAARERAEFQRLRKEQGAAEER